MSTLRSGALGIALLALGVTSAGAQEKWSGFYLGGHGGYGWGNSSTSSDDSVFSFDPGSISSDPKGAFGGATLGYNAQVGKVVFGLEVDYALANIDGSRRVDTNFVSAEINRFGSATGRLGYLFGPALLYAKAGLGFASIRNFATDLADTLDTTVVKDTRFGYTIGGGLEYKLDRGWSIKAEYQFFNFEDQESRNVNDNDLYKHTNDLHTVKLGINYRFGP